MTARVLLLLCLAIGAFADSPLTSIDLFQGNTEHALVKLARTGAPAEFVQKLLADPKLPIGIVAAAVSNVGWDQSGRGALIVKALSDYGAKNPAAKTNVNWQFSHGYLLALVNYLDDAIVTRGLENINQAFALFESQNAKKRSLTIITVKTMMEAQTDMAKDWCLIAQKANKLIQDTKDPNVIQDLHKQALDSAIDYLSLYYSDRCQGVPKPALPSNTPKNKFVTCGKWGTKFVQGKSKEEFFWNIKSGPNAALAQKVFTSEGYANAGNAKRGFLALLSATKNKFECTKGADNKFYLTVESPNGRVVGRGEGYANEGNCRRGGYAVMDSIRILASQKTAYESCGPQ